MLHAVKTTRGNGTAYGATEALRLAGGCGRSFGPLPTPTPPCLMMGPRDDNAITAVAGNRREEGGVTFHREDRRGFGVTS